MLFSLHITKNNFTCKFLFMFMQTQFFPLFMLCNTDSKTLKEEKREELFEELKTNESIGWAVDVIDPRDLSAKMLKKFVQNSLLAYNTPILSIPHMISPLLFDRNKVNLNEISHNSAIGLVKKTLDLGVLLTEVRLSYFEFNRLASIQDVCAVLAHVFF